MILCGTCEVPVIAILAEAVQPGEVALLSGGLLPALSGLPTLASIGLGMMHGRALIRFVL